MKVPEIEIEIEIEMVELVKATIFLIVLVGCLVAASLM